MADREPSFAPRQVEMSGGSQAFVGSPGSGSDDFEVVSPGGSARLQRTATVSNDNAFLEDKVGQGHQFDASQFERLYLIGKGDVGRVYLCRTKVGGKLCAIKVLDQEDMKMRCKQARCRTEREILTLMKHPNIVRCFGTFRTEKFLFFIMEYCTGTELYKLLKRVPNARFEEDEVKFYACQILIALEHLHMMNYVYRDLKPDNILVHGTGDIKLADFDLAKKGVLKNAKGEYYEPEGPVVLRPTEVERTGLNKLMHGVTDKTTSKRHDIEPTLEGKSFVGTPEYMAPEVISGVNQSAAVDWWSYGILLYELMFGTTPFHGSSTDEIFSNITDLEVRIPKDIKCSSQLKDLIMHLLHKNPEKRLGSRHGASEVRKHPWFAEAQLSECVVLDDGRVTTFAAIKNDKLRAPYKFAGLTYDPAKPGFPIRDRWIPDSPCPDLDAVLHWCVDSPQYVPPPPPKAIASEAATVDKIVTVSVKASSPSEAGGASPSEDDALFDVFDMPIQRRMCVTVVVEDPNSAMNAKQKLESKTFHISKSSLEVEDKETDDFVKDAAQSLAELRADSGSPPASASAVASSFAALLQGSSSPPH